MALYDFAKGLILEAGNKVRLMMQEELDIKTKSNPNDLVTNVDKATENYLYETILHNYPDHQVIGEEGHGHNLEYLKGVIWVIDQLMEHLILFTKKKILPSLLVFIMMGSLMQVLFMMS